MNPFYTLVAVRAGRRCEYCHAPEVIFNFAFEVEHITPSSREGSDHPANLALACHSCNRYKSDHLTGIDETTGAEAPLFHPRNDHWDEHFAVDRETGSVVGLTPTGRASVARLRMNSPLQLAARHQWMRLGLYP